MELLQYSFLKSDITEQTQVIVTQVIVIQVSDAIVFFTRRENVL